MIPGRLAKTKSTEKPAIIFGSVRHEEEWEQLHPVLRQIAEEGAQYAFEKLGWLWRITSAIRTYREDKELGGSGIHCTGRALDIRTRGIPADHVDDVTRYINGKWEYDHDRPDMVVAYAKPHGSGPHLHLQVHFNTHRKA